MTVYNLSELSFADLYAIRQYAQDKHNEIATEQIGNSPMKSKKGTLKVTMVLGTEDWDEMADKVEAEMAERLKKIFD